MAKIIPFPDSSRALTEAAQWLTRLDQGLIAKQSDELHRWLAAQALNRQLFTEMAALWGELSVLTETAHAAAAPASRPALRSVATRSKRRTP